MHGFLNLFIIFAIVICNGAQCYNLDANAATIVRVNVSMPMQKPAYAGYQIIATVNQSEISLMLGAPKYSTTSSAGRANGTVINCRVVLAKPPETMTPANELLTTQPFTDVSAQPTPSTDTPGTTLAPHASTLEWQTTVGQDEVSSTSASVAAPAVMSSSICEVMINDNNMFSKRGPNQKMVSDALGSTLLAGDTNENYTVCAPGRQKSCAGTSYSPGACYRMGTAGSLSWIDWGEKDCFLNELDVVFVVDSSNSVSLQQFETMRTVMLNAVDAFGETVGDTTQIAVLQYGDAFKRNPNYASNDRFHYRQPLSFGQCSTLSCVKEKIQIMTHIRASNTYTALAIERAVKLDFANSINKATSKKFLVLITDGASTDYNNLARSYQLTQINNITVYAIGVGPNPVKWQLRQSANGNKNDDRVLFVNDYSALTTTLQNVTKTISAQGGEGQTLGQNTVGERIEYSLFGFSGHHSNKSQTTFIGAVGAYDSTGSVMMFDSTNPSKVDMLPYSQISNILTNFTTDSYLGYSVTSGNYEGSTVEYLAVGAPRYQMHGSVIVYKVEKSGNFSNPHRILPIWCQNCQRSHRQVGSYFGGSVLSTDLNGDGRDDLLIGAPLYIGSQIDEGRVFVYLSQTKDTLSTWNNASFKPLELYGGYDVGGRFGLSMAAAGDLNNDGYNDVAISAPFAEGHRGVVYIYHGSGSGLIRVPKQRIAASAMSFPGLTELGLSLEGGKDLDGNMYPDLILGAPASDSVVILRTRPLARFNTTIRFTPNTIDVLHCYVTQICAQVEVCLYYDGKSVDDLLDVEYNVTVDPVLERVELSNSTSLLSKNKQQTVEAIPKRHTYCRKFNLTLKHGIRDLNAPLVANLQHRLMAAHLAKPLSTIEEEANAKLVSATATFYKGCGVNDTCNYDLIVRAYGVLPTVNNQSATTLMNDNRTLIIASDDSMSVRVNLTNGGDPSFGTRVSLTYSKELSWKSLRTISSSNNYLKCMNDMQDEQYLGDLNKRILTYEQDSQVKDIMLRGSWCFFEVTFSTVSLKDSGRKPNVNISVLAESAFEDKIKEIKSIGNNATLKYAVKYRADVDSRKKSFEHDLVFKFTENTNFAVSSVSEVGGITSSLVIEHEVKGKGYSVIPHSSISLNFPSKLFDEQRLLYLYKLDCVAVGGVTCSCNQSTVNPLQLDTAASGKMNKTYTIVPNPSILNKTFFDCSSASNKDGVICETATCSVKNLGNSDVILLKASFRLWRQTLNLPENIPQVSFTTETSYSTAGSPLIIDNQGRSPTILTYQTVTRARKYVTPVVIRSKVEWWYYVVAATGGVLLLLIIVFIMYKTGFFRSKYKEQLQSEKDPEWNNPDAPESTYVNHEVEPDSSYSNKNFESEETFDSREMAQTTSI